MKTLNLPPKKPKLPPVKIIKGINRIRGGLEKVNKTLVPPPIALLEMVSGMWVAKAIGVIASLGVADHMDNCDVSSAEIARKVKAHPESLYRIMRALSVVGIFTEKPGQLFRLTPMGKCLRTDHPQSMRAMAMFQTNLNWENWRELEYSVRTGKCAAEKVFGMKPFEYLSKNKDQAEVFDNAMTNISKMEVDSILAAFDFSKFKVIADVGGGHGYFLASILSVYPQLKGILYDLPHVVAGAKEHLASSSISARLEIKGGSFFEAIPPGADTYMMKHIIHDWSDEESIKILKLIREQMPSDGTLLLIEPVIPGPNDKDFSKFLDLEMLVVTTGKERTKDEYKTLLAKSGFHLEQIVPTISMANVIQASKRP